MIFTIKFLVEGMPRSGELAFPEISASLLRGLEQAGIRGASFNDRREIFTVELDPALISWSEVRDTVRLVGEREGRILIAVVMSL
jgi:hypothetical protein